MKRIGIIQSNYIPWKGYFDLIASVDEFILFDDMQYTRRDWRNRNRIKTPLGTQWITVPVIASGRYLQRIRDTEIDGEEWQLAHWKALYQNYRRAPYFTDVSKWLEPLYLGCTYDRLTALNRTFIETICQRLNIRTTISNSWDYKLRDGKSERLADLCVQAGGTEYLSGPSAREYLDEQIFSDAGVRVLWFNYQGYPPYPQQWGEFQHEVTILDLLFNCGPAARDFMKCSQK